MPDLAELAGLAAKLFIGRYRRHVFLCVGKECGGPTAGGEAWDALKKELKDRGLSLADGPHACYRTKVECLRVCKGGPVAVVYPEGTYYADLTADRIPAFVQQHLIDGRPMDEMIFARNPLPMAE